MEFDECQRVPVQLDPTFADLREALALIETAANSVFPLNGDCEESTAHGLESMQSGLEQPAPETSIVLRGQDVDSGELRGLVRTADELREPEHVLSTRGDQKDRVG